MKSKNINGLIYILGIALVLMASCSKMNDIQDKYLRKGETIYVGKVDSAKVFAGRERVMLRYWFSDTRATKLMVYWNSRTDSLLLDVPVSSNKDSVDVIISNLTEDNYLFELITMNSAMKDKSIPYQVGGNVYGDEYQATLSNRGIDKITFNHTTGKCIITWLGSVEDGIACDLAYTDTLGNEITRRIPMGGDTTVLNGLDKDLKYRTLFLPEAQAIDTFYTEYESVELP